MYASTFLACCMLQPATACLAAVLMGHDCFHGRRKVKHKATLSMLWSLIRKHRLSCIVQAILLLPSPKNQCDGLRSVPVAPWPGCCLASLPNPVWASPITASTFPLLLTFLQCCCVGVVVLLPNCDATWRAAVLRCQCSGRPAQLWVERHLAQAVCTATD